MANADNAIPIAACVFNAFLSYTTTMLNIITIHALRKTSGLQKNLKTWLLSLSVADLGVGLLVQPLYIALHVMNINQLYNENIIKKTNDVWFIVTNLLCVVSFLGAVAIAFDRFLAIYLHLRYQEIVTHKRIVAVVISIWVLSAFLSFLALYIPKTRTLYIMNSIILIVCLTTAALFYIKIYAVVRHHSQQISTLQAQQVAQNHEQVANAARLKKSTVAVFYAYLVLLVCYLPNISIMVVLGKGQGYKIPPNMGNFTDALLFLNSSLNPLIYCWKMRPIYQTIIHILQNIRLKPIKTVKPANSNSRVRQISSN